MTEQCRSVLAECDFPVTDYKVIEQLLTKHTPTQVMKLVWSKDPDGKHNLEWFLPFFKGYVKRVIKMDPEPDFNSDDFWSAYDLICSKVQELSSFDLAHVQVMSSDIPRIKKAIEKSKVLKAPYIRKVWEDIEPTVVIEYTKVDLDIGNSGVRIRNI